MTSGHFPFRMAAMATSVPNFDVLKMPQRTLFKFIVEPNECEAGAGLQPFSAPAIRPRMK